MRTFNCRSASLSTCHHQHVFNHVICPYWTWLRICLVHSYRLQCHIMWPHPCKWHCTPQSRRHTHTKLRWTKNALVSALSCLMSPMSPFQNVLDPQAWIQFEASTGTMQLPNLQFLFVLSLSLPPSSAIKVPDLLFFGVPCFVRSKWTFTSHFQTENTSKWLILQIWCFEFSSQQMLEVSAGILGVGADLC